MRILHVTSTLPLADGDPTGTFVADLLAAEIAAGLEVRAVAPWAPGATDVVAGAAVHRFRYGGRSLAYRGGLMAAARAPAGALQVGPYLAAMAAAVRVECRRWRPDVVHAHWWFPGGLSALAGRRPMVLTLHGSDVELARRRAIRQVACRVARPPRLVVAVSEALASAAAPLLERDVGVARMPVVVTATRVAERSGPIRLVAAGRLTREKGFDVMLAAVAGSGVQLDVCGDGPLAGSLRAAAGGEARFHGAVSRARLDELIAGADAVLVPSRREGMGLVAVEAVLIGTPVIASATGGLPSALGAAGARVPGGGFLVVDGGALVRPEDASGLRKAILAARDLAAPGPASREAAALHRPEAVASTHVDLYRSVAS